jgi:hypothetical protein
MGGQNESCTSLFGQPDAWQSGLDPGIVRYPSILDRYVEVHSHERSFTAQVEIPNRQLVEHICRSHD